MSREALSGKLPLCHIVIEPARLRGLLSNAFSNEMVDAAFAAGGKVRDVKIRARGAFARSWPKPSWKVIFPRDRPYRGQKRINWNSGWRDPAFIREKVAYDLFRAAGAPSLDSRMVRVHVNGEFWGLFVEVEQPKKQWLARQGIRGAALYKAFSRRNLADERDLGSADAYADHYEIEARKELGYEPLWLFARDLAGARRNLELFEARVDLDAYIPYLCAVAFTQNWDSFNKNHFLALDERGTGKWRVVPWDLDRTLGDHWNWRFDVSNIPVHNGAKRSPGATGWNRMAEAFFSEPALEKRFFDRLGKLLGDVWTEQKLLPLIDELRDAIEEAADLDRARWGGESDWRAAVEGLKRYVRERRAFLIDQVPVNLPATPWNAAPADGAIVSTFPIVLEASPFQHEDPAVRQVASHWQVRAAGGTYATPAADVRSTRGLAGLALPAGKLAPGETYHWRVAHSASNGKTSEFSAETSFRTGDFKLRASAFDLGPLFNKDLVANPGDAANDRLDARGGLLIEDGFDGARTGNPLAQGLPRDRRVGVHRLAPYDGPNAVQLTQRDRRTIRIAARPGRYGMVKLLVAGGTGDSTLPVTFEYADGSRGSGIVPCDDWYDDGPPEGAVGELQPGSTPILNGMDRIRAGFKDRNEPAIFEVTLECDPQRTLTAVLLEAGRGSYGTAQTSFNLFAVTGVEVE